MTLAYALLGIGLVGIAVSAILGWLAHQKRTQLEMACGFEALRTLSWKEFAGYVVRAFEQRDFHRVAEQRKPGDDGVDHLLERQGQRHLLQIKHGGAYAVSAAPVRRMLSMLGVNNAIGGILATSGRFDAAAREAAKRQPIVLLDGEPLWAQLRPLLPASVLADVESRLDRATGKTRMQMLSVAALAIVFGLAGAGLLAFRSATAPPVRTTAQSQPAEPAAAAPAEAATVPVPSASPAPAIDARVTPRPRATDEELAVQRELAAAEAVRVPGVVSVNWPTRSTMLVAISGGDEDKRAGIVTKVCESLMQREDLRFTRLQVHDYAVEGDAQANVRWHQCR